MLRGVCDKNDDDTWCLAYELMNVIAHWEIEIQVMTFRRASVAYLFLITKQQNVRNTGTR